MKLDNDVLGVLRQATFTTDSVKLNGQLERKIYLKVNKALEAAAGQWNRKRAVHIFKQDPHELFNLETGEVLSGNVNAAGIAHAVANGNGAAIVPDLFPTPPELARRMVQLADIGPGMYVLEPSAGAGSIAERINIAGVHLTLIENDARLFKLLAVKFGNGDPTDSYKTRTSILQGDFLCYPWKYIQQAHDYRRVLMNPPFTSDIAHIMHAFKFLAPNGRLVAICAGGPRQEEKLKPFALSHNGTWERLPPNTFKESGTGVNAVLMTAEKPSKDCAWNLDGEGKPIPIKPRPEFAGSPSPIAMAWAETRRQESEAFSLTPPRGRAVTHSHQLRLF